MKRLRIVVGPNGGGKTTFTTQILADKVNLGTYINPDVIAAKLKGDEDTCSLVAQRVAKSFRWKLLFEGATMTYESVMSHPSHLSFLRFAKTLGYRTYLYFIGVANPQISLERVRNRVDVGGHNVPRHKIVGRYLKTMEQLTDAVSLVDRAYVFDNSTVDYLLLVELAGGKLIARYEPEYEDICWHEKYLLRKLV